MSTKRRPQANPESYEALRTLFLRIAEGEPGLIESDDVWRQVARNRWFQAEVRLQAARVLGYNVDDPLCDDLAQQVVLQLRQKLLKNPDLSADVEQLRTNFPGWMAEIIHNACIDTLRRELVARRPPKEAATPVETDDPAPQEDLRIDMAAAIEQLERPEREVALCQLDLMSIRETAEELGMTARQIQRLRKKVKKLMRRLLAAYSPGK